MTEDLLEYGFEWDRDHLMRLASTIRHIFWPISVFLVHPFVLFVLIRKTHMHRECKLAFVVHDVILAFFDIYNGLFYQLYTLLPFPVFACTGILCDAHHSPRMLLTVLAFLTVAQCVPYLFVMMRLHQKMLSEEHRLKLSDRSQFFLMCGFTTILASNVYGFGAWAVDSPEKDDILGIQSIAWARNQSDNFLVLGRRYGDIGLFFREMYLLLFSLIVCFSFYVGITYHAVFVIGKETARTLQHSRTLKIQLRFMISLSIQACFTSLFFILPLVVLFLSMATPLAVMVPTSVLQLARIVLVVAFGSCSLGHSVVFLCKNAWVIQKFRRLTGRMELEGGTITVAPSSAYSRKP